MSELDERAVNTLRFLSVDMVERARSGHPGLPLGAAPMLYVLWTRHLRADPRRPTWWDRDRFVLSAGHGSALLYAALHLAGYDLSLDDLRSFRQLGSRTPGHPEYGHTPGVEATTGPLGQGFANGIGFALAERYLAQRYNRPGFPLVDHWTYALCSDGDLMEGIASEAASFAGALGVRKLVYLYDDNHVSLEGPTSFSFTEDVGRRFESYGWRVSHVEDGNDLEAIDRAISEARRWDGGPSLIRIRTHIGYGSPRQDTKESHGEALGADGVRRTKEKLGWPIEPDFLVPPDVRAHFAAIGARGATAASEWEDRWDAYRAAFPDLAEEFGRAMRGELAPSWDRDLLSFRAKDGSVATRDASASAMQSIAKALPGFLGGSADLAPSTKTTLDGLGDFGYGAECGRNLHFGVREHAMVAICSGLALHGGIVPFGATFLIFSDYAKPALRLAALMGAHSISVFTHDSVGLGEDGPTHQPVEQLLGLRSIPGLIVIRPADAYETVAAWRAALSHPGPTALALTRQKLPVLEALRPISTAGTLRGAYVAVEASRVAASVILIGTGSELHLCLKAQTILEGRGVPTRVVSMPSWELFDRQPVDYRRSILPPGIPRVSVEAGTPIGWERYVGTTGRSIGLERFGASGAGAAVLEQLGFTVDRVLAAAESVLGRNGEKTEP
ncbi:MAG TPA: transketolase [Thermoplasmata archaeon]|nr:transketolase [Thermoplasmata archaeon]